MDAPGRKRHRALTLRPVELGSGAWCWFADPRAVVAGERTHVGWVDGAGDVRVATVDRGGVVTTADLHAGLGVDDHSNPALLLRADGRLQAFYSAHSGPEMFFRLSDEGVHWDAERRLATNTPGRRGYTYPNPVQLAAENGRIHLFWRGGDWNPAFSTSPDGLAWAPAQVLIRVPGQRPYVKVFSDGGDSIHVAFTDGHPRETATSLYYARYTGGGWQRAGGAAIPGPPLEPANADRVYDVKRKRHHAWVHDVAVDSAGRPRIVYAVFESPTDHRYRHARWTGTKWDDRQIVPAGGFFVEDGGEKQYSGGIAFDHANPDVVYLSRPVGGQFEIERRQTADGGVTWSHTAITSGSAEKNVRPVVARGGGVLWMRGAYLNYTHYRTAILTS
jgi:BNR repeat-containing family member